MANSNPKVKVPAGAGPEITMSIGGAEPVVYKVATDGTTTVKGEHLARFLSAVQGATVVENAPPPDPNAPSYSGAV